MKKNVKLTTELKRLMLDQGADLVGVAPVERYKDWVKETHPHIYMQDATFVVACAKHIVDYACDIAGEWDGSEGPGKTYGPYLHFGYGLINWDMSRIMDLASKRLESHGYKALPFIPTWYPGHYRFAELSWKPPRPNASAYFADFSHKHAAVAAGLGEIGWHSLVITPTFGTRVRFCSLITNAPLVADPMYEGPQLCDKKRCIEEFKIPCVSACPSKAIPGKKRQSVTIGGRTFEYALVDHIRCGIGGVDGVAKGSGMRTRLELPRGILTHEDRDRLLQQQHPIDKGLMSESYGLIFGSPCGKCLRMCPAPWYDIKRWKQTFAWFYK